MASSAEQVRIWRLRVRGTEPPYHGTKHAYDAYGCRCGACRAAVAAKQRKLYWRQRRVYSSDMARNPAVDGVLKSKGYDTKSPSANSGKPAKPKSGHVPPTNPPKPKPPKPGVQNDRISGRRGPK